VSPSLAERLTACPPPRREAQEGADGSSRPGGRRRRKRGAGMDVRTALMMLLVMSFMGSMLFLLTKMASHSAP